MASLEPSQSNGVGLPKLPSQMDLASHGFPWTQGPCQPMASLEPSQSSALGLPSLSSPMDLASYVFPWLPMASHDFPWLPRAYYPICSIGNVSKKHTNPRFGGSQIRVNIAPNRSSDVLSSNFERANRADRQLEQPDRARRAHSSSQVEPNEANRAQPHQLPSRARWFGPVGVLRQHRYY